MNDKQKITAGFVVLVLGVFGLGVMHYLKFSERSDMQVEIDRLTRQSQEAQAKIRRIPTLTDEREKLISVIDEYSEILPREEHVQLDAFVDIIDGYRRDTDIIIQRAEYVPLVEKQSRRRTPDQETKRRDFFRHRYKFELLGTVPDLIAFVNKIENHTRFLKVDALRIKPLGAGSETRSSSADQEEQELAQAAEKVKEIELTISTYTYYKGSQES